MNSNISYPGLEEFIITNTFEENGVFKLHLELERKPHKCPECGIITNSVHDYRSQKIKHIKIFGRETLLFYRKRRYKCTNSECNKRFYEDNSLVERYQRQSIEFKQAIAIDLINGKNFKDVAVRFNTSPTTVMRRL